ncbi:MAG: helix-turn-helix domain-containing protein [Chloroflexi bacterium]|nr:helix-turn-helix domain-containing protein [Chloroflexota bacterium]
MGLKEAAKFMCMSPCALREKAKSGLIPAAKPGKSWVFLEDDLVAYLRSLYAVPGQAPQCGSSEEKSLCHYTNAVKPGGFASRRPVDSEYAALLGLPRSNSRRSSKTS